jgi:hypothetical protein
VLPPLKRYFCARPSPAKDAAILVFDDSRAPFFWPSKQAAGKFGGPAYTGVATMRETHTVGL